MRKSSDNKTSGQIINMAFRLFLEKGYEATNLREIGAEAGINASTIYFYYKSKEELFLEILERIYQTHHQQLDAVKPDISVRTNGIKALFFSEIELFLADSAPYKLLLRYRMFPIAEISSEIRQICIKYEEKEYNLWKPYLLSRGEMPEENVRAMYAKIKKLMDALINEMIISGQAINTKALETWWEQYQDRILSHTQQDVIIAFCISGY